MADGENPLPFFAQQTEEKPAAEEAAPVAAAKPAAATADSENSVIAEAAKDAAKAAARDAELNKLTVEEEVETLVQEEMKKNKRMSNLRNAAGVDYAPWMNISEEDEERIRQLMKEKAEARRRRQEEEKSVSGNLYLGKQRT